MGEGREEEGRKRGRVDDLTPTRRFVCHFFLSFSSFSHNNISFFFFFFFFSQIFEGTRTKKEKKSCFYR